MKPDKCSFWFIRSFILDNLNLKELATQLATDDGVARLGLTSLPKESEGMEFEPYVSFKLDEVKCRKTDEYNKDGILASLFYSADRDSLAVKVRRRYLFELTGLCSYIMEIDVYSNGNSKLEIEDLIELSNVFENNKAIIRFSDNAHDHNPSSLSALDIKQCVSAIKGIQPEVIWMDDPAALYGDVTKPGGYAVQKHSPYVVSILGYKNTTKYNQNIAAALEFEASKKEADEPHKLAALLYRFKTPKQWREVDLSYITAFSSRRGKGLENFHLHKKIFVTLHVRSALIAYDLSACERNNHFSLAELYFPALQSTLANACSNWFGFVLVNSYIDDYMQKLLHDSEVKPSEILEVILLLRKRLMGLLNSTVSHKWASGSLSEIYREFFRLFGVISLREDVATKIDLLEKVYSNMQQLSFLLRNEVLDDSNDGASL